MTSSLQIKKSNYYVVLTYYDKYRNRKIKWVSTHLAVKNNKNRANAMIPSILAKYAYLEELSLSEETPLHEFAEDWLARKKTQVEVSTYEKYEIQIGVHIVPFFKAKNLNLSAIQPKHIVEFYNLKANKLAPSTMKSLAGTLRSILNAAVIEGLLRINPALNIPLPVKAVSQDNKYVFLNQQQANEVIGAFEGHNLQPVVFLTLFYALRKSEVLGLKWDAVDFENNTIKIQHTIVKNRSIIAKDRTKSRSSRRTFELLPEIKEMLMEIKDQQKDHKDLFGNCYEDNGYIFVWEDGKIFRPDYVTRSFQRVLKNHNLAKMRFHDLRHSTASILFDLGWDIKRIQEWLGHADIETTANIYTHISAERKCAIAKDLEGIFTLGEKTSAEKDVLNSG